MLGLGGKDLVFTAFLILILLGLRGGLAISWRWSILWTMLLAVLIIALDGGFNAVVGHSSY